MQLSQWIIFIVGCLYPVLNIVLDKVEEKLQGVEDLHVT